MNDEISTSESTNELDNSVFNLKAVVQKTGLKPDTLRAWERRYGLPNPVRTTGGHRLYSQRDIHILHWLTSRQDSGLSISRAVDLWHQLIAEGKDPLEEMPLETVQPEPQMVSTGTNIVQMREVWINACTTFDERAADNVVSQALAMYPVETVCFEILQKGLSEIGVGWYEGRLTAQQEHFASALSMRRLESLVAGTPPPTRQGRILVGCAAEDEHTFPALMLTLLLRRRGWEALYLGANIPIARLEATMKAAKPKLIILTAQTLYTAATLFEMAEVLIETDVPLAFGGLVFSSNKKVRTRIPGHFLGAELMDAVKNAEQILSAPRSYGQVEYGSAETQIALEHFLEAKAKIESRVWEIMAKQDVRATYLARANRDLSKSIAAALTLGDLNFITPDMTWIEGLLMNYNYRLPRELLHSYMVAYYEATKETVDERGQIIVDWLEIIIQ